MERLAIGDVTDALRKPKEITAFLCVADDIDLKIEGYLYKKIPIKDFRPIPPEQLAEAIFWISENIKEHRILVFCRRGVGRSSSVVIGYLISIGFGFGEAIEFVAKKKSSITCFLYLTIVCLSYLLRCIVGARKILNSKSQKRNCQRLAP